MNLHVDGTRFYDKIPVFNRFSSLMDPALYQALPDDWVLGLADVVQSTRAIKENRYKAVNMAGAAVIAAVTNALGSREFPFVFGGDGASFAVPPDAAELAREALATTATWVSEQLELTLRVALVSVRTVRERGADVQVARFGASKNVAYAMFSGGGLAWAEAAMKRGEFAVTPAPAGAIPDLAGLSCRFSEIPALRGVILSLLVMPPAAGNSEAFRAVIGEILELVEASPDAARPVPPGGPAFRWPPKGIELEARAWRSGWPLSLRRAFLFAFTLMGYFVMNYKIPIGGFVPKIYLNDLVENSDFRKYDDGLRMVIDCTPALADSIEQKLAVAQAAGTARYGLHRQQAAMMTCFTPSVLRTDHVHFIDGAHGGYALAALALKGVAA
jgi:hypothetical protein